MRNKRHFRLSCLGNIAAPFGTDGHAGSCLDLRIRIDVQFPAGVTHCALARHGGDERRDVPRFRLNVALEEFGLVRFPCHAQQIAQPLRPRPGRRSGRRDQSLGIDLFSQFGDDRRGMFEPARIMRMPMRSTAVTTTGVTATFCLTGAYIVAMRSKAVVQSAGKCPSGKFSAPS